jgi:hypothetical protein
MKRKWSNKRCSSLTKSSTQGSKRVEKSTWAFDVERRRIVQEKWRSEGSLDITGTEPVWKIADSLEM